MLETDALHRVMQFHVHAQVVGIQLELVARFQAAILVDIEGQGRDIAIDVQLPMLVRARVAVIDDDILSHGQGPPSTVFVR